MSFACATQICNNKLVSNATLAEDVCSPQGLIDVCTGAQEAQLVLASNSINNELTATDQDTRKRATWWIGLVAGLLGFTFLACLATLIIWHKYKKRAAMHGDRSSSDSGGGTLKHTISQSKLSRRPTDTASGRHSSDAPALDQTHDESAIEYPVGRELLKKAALHLAAHSDASLTLSSTERGSAFMTLPSVGTVTAEAGSVLIDMAPNTGPDGLPKLTRNPLGVSLLAVLGTGATGTGKT